MMILHFQRNQIDAFITVTTKVFKNEQCKVNKVNNSNTNASSKEIKMLVQGIVHSILSSHI